MAYFPMFIELEGKHCMIIGGGQVAYRTVEVLADFGAELLVIAPEICEEIKNFAGGNIAYEERAYIPQDIGNCFLVVAATDDEERNHEITQLCRQKKIMVNAVVGAFSSGGNSPVITQYLKACMKRTITPFLGRMADFLGSIRPEVKEKVKTEKDRKAVYQSLLAQGLSEEKLPVWEDVQREMQKRGNEHGQNEKTQTE